MRRIDDNDDISYNDDNDDISYTDDISNDDDDMRWWLLNLTADTIDYFN